MRVVALEQLRVERVEIGRIDLLQFAPADRTTGGMEPHVAAVGLEGGRLDRVLDRRKPGGGQELGERLGLWRDVGVRR